MNLVRGGFPSRGPPALGMWIVNIHFPAHVVVQHKNGERDGARTERHSHKKGCEIAQPRSKHPLPAFPIRQGNILECPITVRDIRPGYMKLERFCER